jgi:TolB protein
MRRLRTQAALLAIVVAAGTWPAARSSALQAVGQNQSQQPEIEIVIGGEPGTPPRYAVPDFVALSPDAGEVAKTIGQVLWDDLAFEREFYLIPRDTYSTVAAARSADQVPFASWRELGADAVFFGTVQKSGDKVVVQVRLFNVRTRQQVFSKEYSGTASNPRLYAHTISDEVHLQQRGLRGVARTKLSLVSDRNKERLLGPIENREVKEIYISDYDGANQRRITTTRQLNINPSWSPDARTVAYSSYRNLTPQIFLSLIYQGVLENITKNVGSNYMPVFSPDGTKIAFVSNRDGNTEIYVMNRDGSNVRRLTNHPAYESTPTWSPNGTQIAFTSDRSGKAQVYIMNAADGSNVRRLTVNESEADRATWSPAPFNEIAYAARTGAWFDIKILELATGTVRQITFGEGSNESPAYSPNGKHLAFSSTRAGGTQVFTIGRDGRGLKQITRSGNNQTPAWSQ